MAIKRPDNWEAMSEEARTYWDRAIAEADEEYRETKARVQTSSQYRGWKSWSPTRRFFTAGLIVIAIVFLVGMAVQLTENIMLPTRLGR